MANKRGLLALLLCVPPVAVMTTTLIAASTPEIAEDFGVGELGRGLIIGLSTVPGVILAPIFGLIADRFGRRIVLSASLLTLTAAGLLSAVAPTFFLFALSRLLIGVGSTALMGLTITSISDHWSGPDRQRMLGYTAAVLALGLTVLPLLGGFLSETYGWRWSMAPIALGLPVAVLIWKFLPDVMAKDSPSISSQLAVVIPELKRPGNIVAIVSNFFIFIIIFGALLTAMPEFLKNEFGASETQRSWVFAIGAISNGAISSQRGRLGRHLDPFRLLAVASVLTVIGFFLVGIAGALWVVLAAVVLTGASEGIGVVTSQEVLASGGGTDTRATRVMVLISISRLGQTVGALGYGYLLSVIDDARPVFYITVAIAGLLAVGQWVAARRLVS